MRQIHSSSQGILGSELECSPFSIECTYPFPRCGSLEKHQTRFYSPLTKAGLNVMCYGSFAGSRGTKKYVLLSKLKIKLHSL